MPEEATTIKVGQYIRQEREPFMTLRSFAKKLGISASYLSDVERGNRKISKIMAMRIAIEMGKIRQHDPDYSAQLHYNKILELSGLMTPERRCLIKLWNSGCSFTTNITLDIFDALFSELYQMKDRQTGGGE
jgi:transcriptional regulator with XRE-family HTH domain